MSKPVKAIGKAVGSVFKAVGSAVSGVVKAVGKVVGAVINFVASPFMGLFGSPGQPNDAQEAARQTGVLIQTTGSNSHIPVVYGYRKLAGTVVYVETGSTNNKYLWVAYTFAEGQAAGLRRIFIDDVEVEGVVDRLNTGFPTAPLVGKFKGRVVLQAWGGGPLFGNDYIDFGNACFLREAPSWKSTHSFNGLVSVFARYEWTENKTQDEANNNPYGGSIPVITIELLGKTVASLVTNTSESSAYGTGAYTERYSTNPAEILLDYLRNPNYGKGLKNTEIDWDSFRTAAAKYNQTIQYVPSASGPYLTLNYIVDTSQSIFSNVKAMLSNMRAYLPYQDGKYKLVVEDAGNANDVTSSTATIVRNFTKDNIVGNIVYTGIEKSSKYNTVVVKFVDPADKWSLQEAVFPGTEAARQKLIADDGGRENRFEITVGGITNWVMAFFMARTILLKSRFQDSVTLTVTSEAFDLEPGDNVYINGTILKFGDETDVAEAFPWRIVSKKLNDDYTFELGCVRNPDFIYPHVRQTERDIVLPPYIPKNAEIQYDGPGREYGVGLQPPSRIRQAVNYSDPFGVITGNPPGFPPPNDPTQGGGGGVGGPNSPTNTNPINDTPPRAIRIPPLEDQIRIDRADFEAEGDEIYAVLSFLQPGHPFYAGVNLYYKRNVPSELVWTFVDVAPIAGEGQRISVRIGALIRGQNYSVRTNVRYSNGQNSVFVGNTTLNNVGSETSTDPADSTQRVGPGWLLPIDDSIVRKDAVIQRIVGAPILTNGAPSDPRRMQITLTQDIFNGPANANIRGVNIYHKPAPAQFFKKHTQSFADSYRPGDAITFELPFTLGIPQTPQDFNFCFRLLYDDGFEGSLQYRFLGSIKVQDSGTIQLPVSVNFNPFAGASVAAAGRESTSAFAIVTESEAPVGSVPDARDLVISYDRTFALFSGTSSAMVLTLNTVVDPTFAWIGVRIFSRRVTPGSNPNFTHVDYSPVVRVAFTGKAQIVHPTAYDIEQQYVIVPLVYHNNQRVEARQAWFAQGALHDRLEEGRHPDFFTRLNFQLIDTDTALNRIKQVFPQQDPTVQIEEFVLEHASFTATDYNAIFYNLTFFTAHITGYQGVDIYRRQRRSDLNFANFFGLGRWEKIVVNTLSESVIVNLRAPISHSEFTNTGAVNPLYVTNTAFPYDSATRHDEFLIVVRTSAGASAKAVLITGADKQNRVGSVNALQGKAPPSVVDVSAYNTYPAQSLRNQTDARVPPAAADLWTNQRYGKGFYIPIQRNPAIT